MKFFGQLEAAQAENLGSEPSSTPWGRFFFDTTLKILKYWNGTAWASVSGRAVTGSRASPSNITAAGITIAAGGSDQHIFVQGNAGAVAVTATPAISAGVFVGQTLKLQGRSDTNTLRLNYDGLTNTLSLNGDCLLGVDDILQLSWDGTNWVENFRS